MQSLKLLLRAKKTKKHRDHNGVKEKEECRYCCIENDRLSKQHPSWHCADRHVVKNSCCCIYSKLASVCTETSFCMCGVQCAFLPFYLSSSVCVYLVQSFLFMCIYFYAAYKNTFYSQTFCLYISYYFFFFFWLFIWQLVKKICIVFWQK